MNCPQGLQFQERDFPPLTPVQTGVRDGLAAKLGADYRLERFPCLCGSRETELLARVDRYGLPLETVICRACGLVRLDPRLSAEALRQFYQKEYRDLYMGDQDREMDGYFKGMVQRGRYIKDLFDLYAPHDWPRCAILDVGSSAGGILVPFLEAGARVRGYDYDRRYLDYGKSRNQGLDLRYGGIDELEAEKDRFDVVIVNHVLEHLADPLAAIAKIRKVLKPEGCLYIAVPGVRNPAYYLSPTKSYLGALHIAHLYQFSSNTLRRCMDGFDVLYEDEKVRAIFRDHPGMAPRTRGDDAARVLTQLHSYETGSWGAVYRAAYAFAERYYIPIVSRLHRWGLLPRRWLVPFTV